MQEIEPNHVSTAVTPQLTTGIYEKINLIIVL